MGAPGSDVAAGRICGRGPEKGAGHLPASDAPVLVHGRTPEAIPP